MESLTILNQEVEKEIQSGEFENAIKDRCAWCGANIPGDIGHYASYGNACSPCNSRFSRIIGGVRGIKKNRKGKLVSYKMREYTEEEKKAMIISRIEEVKIKGL